MKDKEKHIESIAGRHNPFSVPDGYFDDFKKKMMTQLPKRELVITNEHGIFRRHIWRIVTGVAACGCVAIFGIAAYLAENKIITPQEEQLGQVNQIEVSISATTYEEEIVDYTMMDNMDIYAYMAGE